MPEPDWRTELRWMAEAFAATDFQGHPVAPRSLRGAVARYLESTILDHVNAAYRRGLIAGRSQAGYRKSKRDDICPTCLSPLTDAPSAGSPSRASTTEAGEP